MEPTPVILSATVLDHSGLSPPARFHSPQTDKLTVISNSRHQTRAVAQLNKKRTHPEFILLVKIPSRIRP